MESLPTVVGSVQSESIETESVENVLLSRIENDDDDDEVNLKTVDRADGSDSGVEFGGGCNKSKSHPKDGGGGGGGGDGGATGDNDDECRALSRNSSNHAPLRDIYATADGQFSCDSSMLSYCSDENLLEDNRAATASAGRQLPHSGGGAAAGGIMISGHLQRDYASEGGGSESSSVCNQPVKSATHHTTNSNNIKTTGTVQQKRRVVLLDKNKSPPRAHHQGGGADVTATPSRTKVRTPASSIARGPNALKERARSRDRLQQQQQSPLVRTSSVRRVAPSPPDTLPLSSSPNPKRTSTLTRTQSVRTPNGKEDGRWPFARGSTMRLSSAGGKAPITAPAADAPVMVIKTKLGNIALDSVMTSSTGSGQQMFDKYATMPVRRRRERSEDPKLSTAKQHQQQPHQREEIGRAASSTTREKVAQSKAVRTTKETVAPGPTTTTTTVPTAPKLRTAVRRLTQKVKIYHETASQTAVTGKDVENAFAGGRNVPQIDFNKSEQQTVGVQADIRDRELEEIRERVKHLTEEQFKLQDLVSEKTKLLASVEQQLAREKESKLEYQQELQCNSERVLAILESYSGCSAVDMMESSGDSLLMLESKVTSDSQMVAEQRTEIKQLRKVAMTLRKELAETLDRERKLMAEKQMIEKESQEIQEFLQFEKAELIESLKLENDKEKMHWQEVMRRKDREIERLQEECRHLVRFSEQRRQENMGMQAKYGVLEMRSKEMMAQQSNAVSGASVALTNLGVRLESLVEQLIASYNISEQELEDIVYHNEAYPNSGSSGENCHNSPDGGDRDDPDNNAPSPVMSGAMASNTKDLSPQRSQSFINVVINAIRNAASLRRDSQQQIAAKAIQEELSFGKAVEDSEASTDMLDSETEPCLMMENVLSDVAMPDTHSHNLISTSATGGNGGGGLVARQVSLFESHGIVTGMMGATDCADDSSLNNLSQAITDRQQIEQMMSDAFQGKTPMDHRDGTQQQTGGAYSQPGQLSRGSSTNDIPSICDQHCPIIEHVIAADNLITKLLKIFRIIQLDNDNCIQHLIGEKNKLQQNKDDAEDVTMNLKQQFTLVTQQLVDTGNELQVSKVDLQTCRQEIEKLNHHICELSTLCSNNEAVTNKSSQSHVDRLMADMVQNLKTSVQNEKTADGDLMNRIMELFACGGLNAEMMMNNNNNQRYWQQNAISDLKQLYEAIDAALDILNTNQEIVKQYPMLLKLQKDLEETNFTLFDTTLPSYTMAMVAATMKQDMNANPTTMSLSPMTTTSTNAMTDNEKTVGPPTSPSKAIIDSLA